MGPPITHDAGDMEAPLIFPGGTIDSPRKYHDPPLTNIEGIMDALGDAMDPPCEHHGPAMGTQWRQHH